MINFFITLGSSSKISLSGRPSLKLQQKLSFLCSVLHYTLFAHPLNYYNRCDSDPSKISHLYLPLLSFITFNCHVSKFFLFCFFHWGIFLGRCINIPVPCLLGGITLRHVFNSSHRFPSGNNLYHSKEATGLITLLLAAFPSLSHFPTPLATSPSSPNYLHLNLCPGICFWWDPK